MVTRVNDYVERTAEWATDAYSRLADSWTQRVEPQRPQVADNDLDL